jgi:SAM-dependent methyltransferase
MWRNLFISAAKQAVRVTRRLAHPVTSRLIKRTRWGVLEQPNHIAPEKAKLFIDDFPWNKEMAEYHHNHLNRCLKTLDWLWGMPKNLRVLEIGGPPYGMTLLLRKYIFESIATTSCSLVKPAKAEQQQVTRPVEKVVQFISINGRTKYSFCERDFNVETDPWPYEPGSFDLVIACEIFEHLALDPMHAIGEANRVLSPGGRLFITVPNCLAIRNVIAILEGRQPNSFPFYRPCSVNYRHNRELTPTDLAALYEAGGFAVERLECMNAYPQGLIDPLKLLGIRALGGSLSQRGDMLVGMGRKVGAIRERYPTASQLYYKWDVSGLLELNR